MESYGEKIEMLILSCGIATVALSSLILAGCSGVESRLGPRSSNLSDIPDNRQVIPLNTAAGREHRKVMLQHLESVQLIVQALAEEDYGLAKGLTESHLGFFMHRQAMANQDPGNFPPSYHDLAMAHHEAAEELARTIPTQDLKQILPKFNNVLKACVACHLEYKVKDRS